MMQSPLKTQSPGFTFYLSLIFLLFSIQLAAQNSGRVSIRMEGGEATFYLSGTGERFAPRGFNYIQLVDSPAGPYGESELFHPDSHNPLAIDDDFQRMAALGYNAVRVFVDLCRDQRCIANEVGLKPEYIANIIQLLRRAEQYGLYVMLTANWLPDLGGYSGPAHSICKQSGNFSGGNCLVMSSKGVELYAKFFTDLILALKAGGAPMESIWAYELRNEFFVEHNYPPFTLTSGNVTAANGISYNMASQADKKKMGEDAVVYWANTIRNAIKALEPDALVTSGFFTPNEPNIIRPGDPRIVPFVAALERSDLDFFGIHAYAGFTEFQVDAENYGIIGYAEKPVVLGEYGSFLPNAPDVYVAAQLADHWQADACSYGVDGFTFWTWDRHRIFSANPDDPWGGSDEQAFIGKVLSPFYKSNSCDIVLPKTNIAEGKPASASMVWPGYPASNVVDGNATQTPWIAGSEPPQWVEVDLLQPYDLAAIQIVVETGSDDPFFYTHEIQVKTNAGDSYQTIHTFAAERVNFEVLTWPADGNGNIPDVRFVRVHIPQAPGWAALHELRALLPQNRAPFDVPAPPILTFPRPGMDAFTGTLVRWKNDVANLSAHIQLASDAAFQNIVDEATNITADEYDIGHLNANDQLYWRVMQSNNLGNSYWSVTGFIDKTMVSNSTVYVADNPFIYPNPANNWLYLSGDIAEKRSATIEIFSAAGQKVFTCDKTISTRRLDISTLAAGVYLLLLRDDQKTTNLRFVKM